MSHHKVELRNLHYTYPDGMEAVRGVNLQIHHGEAVAIVGANGAGKSTLLTLLVGILFPTKGEIRIGETPLTKKTLPLIRQRIGYTFQNPDNQLFMTKVYDDVAFGPRNYQIEEPEVERRVVKALGTVGSIHLINRASYKLSGGEKRSVAIASVLSMEPDILIMDEPTAALDPKSRRRLIELLKGFSHTKIIATHDLDMALELCERTIVVKEGSIVSDGPSLELLSNAKLMESCGLELPLTIQGCLRCNSIK